AMENVRRSSPPIKRIYYTFKG
ncbi:hypothetical protein CCACVL1_06880, partial [Corchorus capsularis]